MLLDSVSVPQAGTIGDVQVSSDGRYLVVCTEPGPGFLYAYDLTDPVKPRLVSTFSTPTAFTGHRLPGTFE